MNNLGGIDMLYDLINSGFGKDEDFNCAEKILYGAKKAYRMNLDEKFLKLAGGFGGGMFVEGKCGAVVGGIMVLSYFYNDSVAHESPRLKDKVIEFQLKYEERMGSTICGPLKGAHRTESEGCKSVILEAAKILDELVEL